MLRVIVKICGISRDNLLEGLKNEASDLPEDVQRNVMEYFEEHYPE